LSDPRIASIHIQSAYACRLLKLTQPSASKKMYTGFTTTFSRHAVAHNLPFPPINPLPPSRLLHPLSLRRQAPSIFKPD